MSKKTLVIGASEKPERYSNKAIKALRKYGHQVVAIALRTGRVEDVAFDTEKKSYSGIDTVTLYVGPQNQSDFYDYVEKIKPRRVIFNPGTENKAFADRLKASGIETEEACTLVLLGIGAY
ncbi:CoA-binding protein [uncultured Sunxiuqinia sp.]|uniref:CoA-binding protein n=1 Tax=uncultured Sunxiuqinia sp. TaxID=1573825 RepID=UPI0030DC2EEF|tara:strand:- start:94540 stop:94902 length:363 start_codon:yes stop_codon:yes gene_type:complete